jgi:hypothetical protein
MHGACGVREMRLLWRGEWCLQQPTLEFKARTALLENASTGGLCCRLCLVAKKGSYDTLMGLKRAILHSFAVYRSLSSHHIQITFLRGDRMARMI